MFYVHGCNAQQLRLHFGFLGHAAVPGAFVPFTTEHPCSNAVCMFCIGRSSERRHAEGLEVDDTFTVSPNPCQCSMAASTLRATGSAGTTANAWF